jgi:hypothetical protein
MDEKIEAFFERMSEKQKKILELHQELENLKAEYRAEMKARVGICDGESHNVLDYMKAVQRVLRG